MRFNADNEKNRTTNGSRCRDPTLPDRCRTGSGNGYRTQQVYLSRIAGVLKGDHPPCSTEYPVWYPERNCSEGGYLMTRGIRPVAGIAEAKRRATAWGFTLIEIGMEAQVPFDFGIHYNGSASLVRVRRLKNHGYRVELIGKSCADQIRELRELPLPGGVAKELWVRGPERAWHRYRVLPETVEVIPDIPNTRPSTAGETGMGKKMDCPGR